MTQTEEEVSEAGTGEATEVGRFTRFIRLYPVTASVIAPYALLIFPSAILNANPSLAFLFGVFLIATLTTFFVESFLPLVHSDASPVHKPRRNYDHDSRFIVRLAIGLMYFGLVASIITASMGIGTIDSAVGISSASTSSLGTILSLLSGWDIVGTGLFVWSRAQGYVRSRVFLLIISSAIALKLMHVVMLGITVQLWRYLICVFFLLIFFKLIRFRTIIAVMIIVVVAWPVFFEIRNNTRSDRGVAVSEDVDASDRIRYDLQIARADGIPPGLDLGQLSNPLDILRYGLIPRFLDPDRGIVATGRLINQYLGGTATSSYTFLPVTTSYILGDWYGTVLLYAWWATFTFFLLRNGTRAGPYRTVLFAMLLVGPLNWFTVHPDSAIGFLQDLVAASPVLIFMAFHLRQGAAKRNTRALSKNDK